MPTLRSGPSDGADSDASYVVDGGGMIPFTEFRPDQAVLGDAPAMAAFYERLAPQSARTLAEPFHVDLPAGLDKTYVCAAAEPSSQFRSYAAAARRDPAWRYVEVPATHWLMISHAAEVAAIILNPERA